MGGAVLIATTAPVLLRRCQGMVSAPTVGLVAWLGAAVAALGMMVAAGPLALLDARLWLAAHAKPFSGFLAGCIGMLHRPGAAAFAASLLASAIVVYVFLVLVRTRSKRRSQARAYSRTLERLGRYDARLGALVVPYSKPVCFCLSGDAPLIVISSGALQTLTARQLDAVLSHERAHLNGRHHTLTAAAQGLSRALPLPLFRALPEQIELLVERLADERAGNRCGRDQVASALLRMMEHTVPGTALAATGGSVQTRVSYLLDPAGCPRLRLQTLASWLVAAAVTALGPATILTLACGLSLAP
ncbi:M56 family metallopeptidase [Saccharopolyspora shandongensis]|uniref:M56 family metallopeptidase n=1 Tax=Saccharopolyspora shandongensis TaxID=418495 RepID=UPI003449FB5F